MTVEIVAKVAAATTLADINVIVARNEETVGPLVGIGYRKGLTMLTFAIGDTPAPYATIAADAAGTPSMPTGATAIDTDLIFIEGKLVLCTASRQ
jgi:hypothetical protein